MINILQFCLRLALLVQFFHKATRYDAHGRNRVLRGLRKAIHAAFAHAAAKPCLRFASCEFELADETPDIAGRMPFAMA